MDSVSHFFIFGSLEHFFTEILSMHHQIQWMFKRFHVSCTHTQRPFHCKHSSLQSITRPSIFDLIDTSSTRLKQLSFLPSAASVAKNIHIKLNIPDEMNLLSNSGGEDSYFIRSDSLGVADGVGGWVSVKGANSALYSRMLMHYSAMEFKNFESPDFEADPLPLLGMIHFHLINKDHENSIQSMYLQPATKR
jgi:hypothetical protein